MEQLTPTDSSLYRAALSAELAAVLHAEALRAEGAPARGWLRGNAYAHAALVHVTLATRDRAAASSSSDFCGVYRAQAGDPVGPTAEDLDRAASAQRRAPWALGVLVAVDPATGRASMAVYRARTCAGVAGGLLAVRVPFAFVDGDAPPVALFPAACDRAGELQRRHDAKMAMLAARIDAEGSPMVVDPTPSPVGGPAASGAASSSSSSSSSMSMSLSSSAAGVTAGAAATVGSAGATATTGVGTLAAVARRPESPQGQAAAAVLSSFGGESQ
eukprot:m51a1_g1543 hypothetical protein (273) ;mRNA; f:556052-557148